MAGGREAQGESHRAIILDMSTRLNALSPIQINRQFQLGSYLPTQWRVNALPYLPEVSEVVELLDPNSAHSSKSYINPYNPHGVEHVHIHIKLLVGIWKYLVTIAVNTSCQ